MEEALSQVLPEQGAMVEQMMKKRMNSMGGVLEGQIEMPKIDIRRIGRSDNVIGYACEYYVSFSNDQKEA